MRHMQFDKTARYLKIVRWARRRYASNGLLAKSHAGDKSLSAYSAIEEAAWDRYMV